MTKTDTLGPDPIDVAAGANVRRIRKARGISQSKLADAVGVSFQQIQKYERGANRISLSVAVVIARRLDVPWTALLEGVDTPKGQAVEELEDVQRFTLSGPGWNAVSGLAALPDHLWTPAAQAVVAMVEAMGHAANVGARAVRTRDAGPYVEASGRRVAGAH